MGLRMSTLQVNDDSTRQAYEACAGARDGPRRADLRRHQRVHRQDAQLQLEHPVLHPAQRLVAVRQDRSRAQRRDRRVPLLPRDKSRSNEYFNAPWGRAVVKNNKQRNAEVVTSPEPGGKHQRAVPGLHPQRRLPAARRPPRWRGNNRGRQQDPEAGRRPRGASSTGSRCRCRLSMPPAPPPPDPSATGSRSPGSPRSTRLLAMDEGHSTRRAVREALGAPPSRC